MSVRLRGWRRHGEREDSARYIAIARPPPHWFVEPLIGTALYQEIYIGLGCGTSGFSLKSLPVSSRRLLSIPPRELNRPASRWLTTITSPPFLTNVLPHGISSILLQSSLPCSPPPLKFIKESTRLPRDASWKLVNRCRFRFLAYTHTHSYFSLLSTPRRSN